MKHLFDWIETLDLREGTKLHLAFWMTCPVAGVLGAMIWWIVQLWCLRSWDWLVCFIGYPVIISWFVVLMYSYNYDFHNGKHIPVKSQPPRQC